MKQRNNMSHATFYRLIEWLKGEQRMQRLNGNDRESVAARAQKELGFDVNIRQIIKAAETGGGGMDWLEEIAQ